jgi:hypothetical protein
MNGTNNEFNILISGFYLGFWKEAECVVGNESGLLPLGGFW